MNPYLRSLALLCLSALLWPGAGLAGKFRQPAYITNLYFSDQLAAAESASPGPNIFNKLKAGDDDVSAYLLLDMVVDSGEHHVEIEILDSEGRLFDKLEFEPVLAAQDNWRFMGTGRFGGALPDGGLFFRVYDSHEGNAKAMIGTFRLMTGAW